MIVARRLAVASAAVASAVGLGALVAPGAVAQASPAAVTTAARWAPAATAAVHPGVVTVTSGGGSCTANFVFTDGGRVLLGQAAHCAGTGAATETDGCTSATRPLGTTVSVRGSDGRERTGRMVYSSWLAMRAAHERDASTCAYNDFALVELAQADRADVNPTVPFFGGPTGLHRDDLPVGSPLFTYGNSPTRLGVAALSPKAGTTAGNVGGGWGHEVYTASPGIPGDSGSGFLTADGAAVGVLTTLNLAPLPVSNGMTDLARAMQYAASHGVPGLALVPGTEAFDPAAGGLLAPAA